MAKCFVSLQRVQLRTRGQRYKIGMRITNFKD
nr:MAG TPA: hypothetical protein [Caudoviricetes sp.]DAV95579.1 MAG TPA: hypothetical protein [Caudoviricetes sp.]